MDVQRLRLMIDSSAAKAGADDFRTATTQVGQSATAASTQIEKMQGSIEKAATASSVSQGKLDALTEMTTNLGAANAETTGYINQIAQALAKQAAAGELTTEQVIQLTAAEKALAGAGDEVVVSNEGVDASTKQVTDSTRAMTLVQMQAIKINEELAASNVAVATTSAGSGLQLGLLRRGMTSLMAEATGTSAVLDRVGGSFASMAVGTGLVIGVVAGIAAIAFVYDKVTASARAAQKAADDFSKSNEGRAGAASGMAIANFSMAGQGSDVTQQDIPAATDQIDKLTKAVKGYTDQLDKIKGSGYSAPIAALAHDLVSGAMGIDQFDERLRALAPSEFFFKAGQDVAKMGGELIAARDELVKYTAAVEQAKAMHTQLTVGTGAASDAEGALAIRVHQATQELAAYQSGGKLAGDRVVEQNKALEDGQSIWAEHVKSVQGATVASLTFQAALAQGVPDAKRIYDQLIQLADAERQMGVTKADPTNALAESLTRVGDAVAKFKQSADSVGKDQSINAQVTSLTDQINTLDRALQEQVKTGKLNTDQYKAAAGQLATYRDVVNQSADALKAAADNQLAQKDTESYQAQLQLNSALKDGVSSVSDLNAAKQAQAVIDAEELTLGTKLSDSRKQQIQDTFALAAANKQLEGAQAIQAQADAINLENDALKQGESTRDKYLINKQADIATTKAKLIEDDDARTAMLNAIEALRQASLAHVDLTTQTKDDTAATKEFDKANQAFAKSLSEDVTNAVLQFTSKGVVSFKEFFQEAESLSLHMVTQIESDLARTQSALAEATKAGDTTLEDSIKRRIADLQEYQKKAQNVGVAIAGATAGYAIGEATGNEATGAIGGAASGAISGFAVAGPLGAVIGGLSGAAGGLLGAADAHDKAAAALEAAAKALEATKLTDIQSVQNIVTPPNSVQQELASLVAANDKVLSDIQTQAAHGDITEQQSGAQQVTESKLYQAALKKFDQDFSDSITQQINAAAGPLGQMANALDAAKKAEEDNITSAVALGLSTADVTKLYDDEVAAIEKQEAAREQAITDSLAVGVLSAEGLDTESAALQRQIDERNALQTAIDDDWTDAQKAQLKYEEALQDVKTATDAAATATQALSALQVRYLTAIGDTTGADNASRSASQAQEVTDAQNAGAGAAYLGELYLVHAYENAAALVAQQTAAQVDAIQTAADAESKRLDALISSAQDQLKVTQDQLSTAQQSLEDTQRLVQTLTDFGKSLQFSTLSPLSPADQLTAARQALEDTYNKAIGGDQTAAAAFPDQATQFLTIDRANNASTAPYEADFANIQKMTDTLTAQFGATADTQTQILAELQTQTDQLNQQIAAMQAQQTAEAAAAAAEISALQEQVNQSKLIQQAVVQGVIDTTATALANAGEVVSALAAVRGSLGDPGQTLVDTLTNVIASNEDAVSAASQAEVDAINAGASETTVAQLQLVTTMEEQRLDMNTNAASQIVALEGLAGISQTQIDSLESFRDQADQAAQDSIAAIQNGADATTQAQLSAIASIEQQRLEYNERMDKEIANTAAIYGVGSDQVAALQDTQSAVNTGFASQIGALDEYSAAIIASNGGDPTGGQAGAGGTGGTPTGPVTGSAGNPAHVVLDTPLSVNVYVTVDSNGGSSVSDVPAFADGGSFGGGVALVGERGPELVAMGPARVVTAEDTAALFQRSSDDALVAATNTTNRLLTSVLVSQRAADNATNARLKSLEDSFATLVQQNRFVQKGS